MLTQLTVALALNTFSDSNYVYEVIPQISTLRTKAQDSPCDENTITSSFFVFFVLRKPC